MKLFARFFARPLFVMLTASTLGLSLVSGSALAQKSLVEGRDYDVLVPAQPVEVANKIEIIEFFGYKCPHCNALDPVLNDWIKRQGADIVVRHIPVDFDPDYKQHQRLYYTLDVLGKEGDLRANVFAAIHANNNRLNTPDLIADWAAKNGLDRKKFTDTFNSFTVQAKVQRASQLMTTYGVRSIPTIIVGGKYSVNVSPTTIGNLDYFVEKEKALLKPVAAAPVSTPAPTPAATPAAAPAAPAKPMKKEAAKDTKKN